MTKDVDVGCAGCSHVVISQKINTQDYLHYESRTGTMWHLECYQIHRDFMESIEGVK